MPQRVKVQLRPILKTGITERYHPESQLCQIRQPVAPCFATSFMPGTRVLLDGQQGGKEKRA